MAKTLVWNQRDQGLIRFTNIYYVKYVYISCTCACKCIVPRWVVYR
jgi:hypothetical protein